MKHTKNYIPRKRREPNSDDDKQGAGYAHLFILAAFIIFIITGYAIGCNRN